MSTQPETDPANVEPDVQLNVSHDSFEFTVPDQFGVGNGFDPISFWLDTATSERLAELVTEALWNKRGYELISIEPASVMTGDVLVVAGSPVVDILLEPSARMCLQAENGIELTVPSVEHVMVARKIT